MNLVWFLNRTKMNNRIFVFLGVFLAFFIFLSSFSLAAKTGTDFGSFEFSDSKDGALIKIVNAYCGDGKISSILKEQCDGLDLGGATCSLLSYNSGTVSCKSNCVLDFSGCYNSPTIDSGISGSSGSSGGGGGSSSSSSSSSSSCIVDWDCSEWRECKDGIQTRVCVDLSNCRTDALKPSEERECLNEGISGDEATMEGYGKKGFFRTTGNAIADSFTSSGKFIGWLILALIGGGLFLFFYTKKGNKKIKGGK